jgi:transketolase
MTELLLTQTPAACYSHCAEDWRELRLRSQLRLLQMHYESGVGHIGGNLSCLDLLLYLHHHVMRPRDQFVLSKGHAAGALYVTLWTLGRLTDAELCQFHRNGTRLSGHPPPSGLADVPFATGSLGHGFSLAVGLALAKRFKEEPGRVYCLTSDGEWNEGSNWEALIFARQQRLENLTVIVDANGWQGFGATQEVADLSPLGEKFRAFGAYTKETDGHDPQAMGYTFERIGPGPNMIVAKTRKGCGVSFMEDRMEWHYLPLNDGQYQQAIEEIQQACAVPSASRS